MDFTNGITLKPFKIKLAENHTEITTPEIHVSFPGWTEDDFLNMLERSVKIDYQRIKRSKHITKHTGEDKKVTLQYDDDGFAEDVNGTTEFEMPRPGKRESLDVKKAAKDVAVDVKKKYPNATPQDMLEYLLGEINLAELAKRHFENYTKEKEAKEAQK